MTFLASSDVQPIAGAKMAFPARRLRFACQEPLKYGANAAAEFDNADWPRFIRITDITESGQLKDSTFRSLPPEIANDYLLRSGDLLLARSGSIGRTFIYAPEWGASCFAGYLIRARLSADFDPKFVYWALNSSEYWGWVESIAIRSTIQNVSAEKYADYEVPAPPLETQQRIARFLDEKTARIDSLIAKKQALLERLAEKRQALITRAVTKGLNPDAPMKPSGLDWVDQIPAHWDSGNIRRFAAMKTGHTPSRSTPEYWDDCTISWFTLADVWQIRDGTRWYLEETSEKISELGLANSAAELLPAGTVILSRTASVGFSGIMPIAMATSQDFWNWVCGPKLLPEYLLLVFRAMTDEFELSTNGSTHKTIYQGIAAGLRICVPGTDEQSQITAFVLENLRKMDEARQKVGESIDALRAYRAALITAAVTDQLPELHG